MPESNFVDVFGNYPQIRIMDFFLKNPKRKCTLKEIVEETKSDHPIADAFVSRLVLKKYLLEEVSTYRVNLENPMMQKFLELDWENMH